MAEVEQLPVLQRIQLVGHRASFQISVAHFLSIQNFLPVSFHKGKLW
jgi:hypothetical protein